MSTTDRCIAWEEAGRCQNPPDADGLFCKGHCHPPSSAGVVQDDSLRPKPCCTVSGCRDLIHKNGVCAKHGPAPVAHSCHFCHKTCEYCSDMVCGPGSRSAVPGHPWGGWVCDDCGRATGVDPGHFTDLTDLTKKKETRST